MSEERREDRGCDAFAKKFGQDHCWAYSPNKAVLEDWAHKGPWSRSPSVGTQWRRCTNCGRMEQFTEPDTLPPCMEPDGGSCCPQYHRLQSRVKRLEAQIDGLRSAMLALINAKALKGIRELVAGWNGEGKKNGPYPRHHSNLGARIETNCGAIYELDELLTAAIKSALSARDDGLDREKDSEALTRGRREGAEAAAKVIAAAERAAKWHSQDDIHALQMAIAEYRALYPAASSEDTTPTTEKKNG